MAQRRMFNLKIVDSDAFMDMPQSSQLLYFHLSMRADDDGFVSNPKRIMRAIGSNEDDYTVLLTKRFVIPFENGVCVIKHWRMHNYIQNDRYQPTSYIDEKAKLSIKENGAYTMDTKCIQDVSTLETQVRVGKGRIGEVRLGQDNKLAASKDTADPINQVLDVFYKSINPAINYANKYNRNAAQWLVAKYGLEKTLRTAEYACSLHGKPYAPQITTPGQLKEKLSALKGYFESNREKATKQSKVIDLSNL